MALRIAVGVATAGRPQMLRMALAELAAQSRRPDLVIVCAPGVDDVGELAAAAEISVILGPRGLTRQRNAILERAALFDALVFFDDDFVPAPSYLAAIEHVLAAHHDIAMITGTVVADGITGPGLTIVEARQRLAQAAPAPGQTIMHDVGNGYGCNMTVRMAAVTAGRCRFDDRLPLYGWLEDVDFSRQIAPHGRIVRLGAAQGVHLGVKQGRQSGVRLGYSQIANPIYLWRKGTYPPGRALRLMSRNIAANCLRSLNPEPYIDRSGRVAGNFRAFRDLLAGRLAPERILEL